MRSHKRIRNWTILLVIVMFLTFFQLPYYVTTPGLAKKLAPIIEVDDGYDSESGNFMLTTIRIGRANIIEFAWAKINDYHYILEEKDVRRQGETDDEYQERQLHMMDSSKDAATYTAYKEAGRNVTKYVLVYNVLENMPAFGKLQAGDKLLTVDKTPVQDSEQLIEYLSNKEAGDIVNIMFKREEQKKEISIGLKAFSNEEERVGLGIQLVTETKVEDNQKVTIRTDEIGGPSAGLMFTLEIYNQLVEEDITRGLEIAGTGTIDFEGVVGRIGGIQQKVVAAHKAGAEVFFAPNENGRTGSNYEEAVEAAIDIGTPMEIVPVNTFKDALQYLNEID